MKRSDGLKKIAIRQHTPAGAVYSALAEHVIGSKKMLVSPGLMVYCLADGTIMELYGPGSDYPAYLFADSDVVISYKVASIETALSEIGREHLQVIRPSGQSEEIFRFCHIRVPGQSLFGIYEVKALPSG